MDKKFILSFITFIIAVFSFTYVFATDMSNDMQDTKNTATNIVNKTEETTKNATENITKDTENTASNITRDMSASTDNETYTATRTATTNDGTLMGMNATTWTWVILGIAAIAIIALVWYYSMQFSSKGFDNRDE